MSEQEQVIPCRPKCAACAHVLKVDYYVSDEKIWRETVKPYYRNSIICLNCFTRWADEKLLRWCKHIELYPRSLRSQLDYMKNHGLDGLRIPPTEDKA